MPTYRIIDVHTHIFPEKIARKAVESVCRFYGVKTERSALPDDADAAARACGIERSLVFSTATAPRQVRSINDFIHAECGKHPAFIGLGTLHPDMEDPAAEIERIRALGLHGVKLHPDFQDFAVDDPRMLPVYRLLARARLPVLIHMGDPRRDLSSPARLARLLDAVPELRVIAAHFGGWSVWDEAVRLLAGSGAWFDTSSTIGFVGKEKAREMIARYGVDRLLFGTDYLMWDIGEELDRFFSLGLSEEDNRLILAGNLERAFPEMLA